jgi:hypothetical protein
VPDGIGELVDVADGVTYGEHQSSSVRAFEAILTCGSHGAEYALHTRQADSIPLGQCKEGSASLSACHQLSKVHVAQPLPNRYQTTASAGRTHARLILLVALLDPAQDILYPLE